MSKEGRHLEVGLDLGRSGGGGGGGLGATTRPLVLVVIETPLCPGHHRLVRAHEGV